MSGSPSGMSTTPQAPVAPSQPSTGLPALRLEQIPLHPPEALPDISVQIEPLKQVPERHQKRATSRTQVTAEVLAYLETCGHSGQLELLDGIAQEMLLDSSLWSHRWIDSVESEIFELRENPSRNPITALEMMRVAAGDERFLQYLRALQNQGTFLPTSFAA